MEQRERERAEKKEKVDKEKRRKGEDTEALSGMWTESSRHTYSITVETDSFVKAGGLKTITFP